MALTSFAKTPNPFLKRTQPAMNQPVVPGQPGNDLDALTQTKQPATASQPTQMARAPMPAQGSSFEPPKASPVVQAPQPTPVNPYASQLAKAPGPAMGSSFEPPPATPGPMVQAPRPQPQMESQQQNAAAQNAAGAAAPAASNVTDLNALVGGNLTSILQGKNPAMEQANRSAMNGLGMMQKQGQEAALRKAASLGFAPGSPEFERVMSEAETANTSAGSQLLSGLAQKGLDEQNQALSAAGNFALGQQNFGLNALKRGDQVDQFGATLDQRKNEFGVSSAQDQQRIDNQAGQFNTSAGMEQQRINQQGSQFDKTFGSQQQQEKVRNLESIITNPLSSIAEVNAAKAQLRDINQLGAGAAAADPNNAELDLESIKQSLRVRYPTMSEAELDAKARQQYGVADDAYWKSLGMGAAIDAPPAGGTPGGAPASGNGAGTDALLNTLVAPFKPGSGVEDSLGSTARGLNNLVEGNVLTGTGQVVGGLGSMGVNAVNDVVDVAGDAAGTAGRMGKRALSRLRFW